jgi:hypothetical protein
VRQENELVAHVDNDFELWVYSISDWPVEVTFFELTPSFNQVVFDGDQLSLSCLVQVHADGAMTLTHIPSFARVTWYINGAVLSATDSDRRRVSVSVAPPLPMSPSPDVDAHPTSFPANVLRHRDQPVVKATVDVRRLTADDTGTWTCVVETPSGRASQSISVSVVGHRPPSEVAAVAEHAVLYCPSTVVETDRGRYSWPRTVVGTERRLPCVFEGRPAVDVSNVVVRRHDDDNNAGSGSRGQVTSSSSTTASYRCISPGRWVDLDVGRCQFAGEFTRTLASIASVGDLTALRWCCAL